MTTEHPEYGTCTGCTQAKRVKRSGLIWVHTTDVVACGGNAKATIECPGSDKAYAEQSRQYWDSRRSGWFEMEIDVHATLHTDESERPFIIGVQPWSAVKSGHRRFLDEKMSIHAHLLDRSGYVNVYSVDMLNEEGHILRHQETVRDDGNLNGLVLRWMEQLHEEKVAFLDDDAEG